MPHPSLLLLIGIGLVSGIFAGIFGVGGGIIIVPALVYLAGFRQHVAMGTSLALLLPPIGLAAAWEYYRHGNVDIRAAVVIAISLTIGGWFGAVLANRMSGPYLRLAFGVFVLGIGVSLIVGACKRLGWF